MSRVNNRFVRAQKMKDFNFVWTVTAFVMALITAWGLTIIARLASLPSTPMVALGTGSLIVVASAWYYGIRTFLSRRREFIAMLDATYPVPVDQSEPDTSSTSTSSKPLAALLALILPVYAITTGCTRVEAGHVGIKVNYAGTDRGVDSYPAVTGWVFYMPGASGVFEWPTYMQNAVWTAEDSRLSPGNEELCFNSSEGLALCGDFSIAFMLNGAKVPHFYVKYRTDDLFHWTHGYLKNLTRDEANAVASKLPIEVIYGEGKEQFILEIRKRVQEKVAEDGVIIDQFGTIGRLRLPEIVDKALNSKIAATQEAIRAENQLRQTQAEALKTIEKARGEAEANRILTESLSPTLLRWRQLQIMQEKWDGKYPQVVSGDAAASLMIGVDKQ